jgi:cell wall-associated NlpC family hydrolase
MTISKQSLLQRCAALAVISFASICSCSIAADVEVLPEQTKVTASNPEKPKGIFSRTSELAMQAMGMLGIHYKRGGNTPESGLDCSGLVDYVYKEAWGTTLPRTSIELSKVGKSIKMQDLQAGDLVFFNTLRRGFSHVGIYLGEHKFIHAPSPGGQVRIESMDVKYWKKRFNGARRISDVEQAHTPTPQIELSGPIPY